MHTLFIFLIRRDQVPQLVVYVLLGLVVLALHCGTPGAARAPDQADDLGVAGTRTAAVPLLR